MTKKEAILIAAQEAFGQRGFTATTVKDVASGADVSFGLVSHYFGSKQDLFLAAGFDMADRIIAVLQEATHGEHTGLKAIQNYMDAYFNFTLEYRETFPILLRCSPFSHIEPGLDVAKVAEKFSVFIEELERCVQIGIADGTIIDLPAAETALIIYGNIVGSVRTTLLTPYKSRGIFQETIKHVTRSISTANCENK